MNDVESLLSSINDEDDLVAASYSLGELLLVKSFRIASIWPTFAEVLAVRYDLNRIYYPVMEKFNWDKAPYHNAYHTKVMMCLVYEAAYHEKPHGKAPFWDAKLPDGGSWMRGMLLGALMHDYDHTQGAQPDSVNIERALAGLYKFVNQHGQQDATNDELALAESAIRATQYPYVTPALKFEEMVIRDADLMMLYEEDGYRLASQFLGLKLEVEKQRETTYTIEEWAQGVYDFNAKTKWLTGWGEEKASTLRVESYLERLKKLILAGP